MSTLALSPGRILTRWEQGLLDIARDYRESGGHSFYGSWIRALESAAAKGCKNRRQFRTVVADILDCEKDSVDMARMANCAAFGRLYDVLSGRAQYSDVFVWLRKRVAE